MVLDTSALAAVLVAGTATVSAPLKEVAEFVSGETCLLDDGVQNRALDVFRVIRDRHNDTFLGVP